MTMAHKEALAFVASKSIGTPRSTCIEDDIEAAIRAYVEARGLVLVPKEATYQMKQLSDAWTSDAGRIYRAMLAAAPDPFEEGE